MKRGRNGAPLAGSRTAVGNSHGFRKGMSAGLYISYGVKRKLNRWVGIGLIRGIPIVEDRRLETDESPSVFLYAGLLSSDLLNCPRHAGGVMGNTEAALGIEKDDAAVPLHTVFQVGDGLLGDPLGNAA